MEEGGKKAALEGTLIIGSEPRADSNVPCLNIMFKGMIRLDDFHCIKVSHLDESHAEFS